MKVITRDSDGKSNRLYNPYAYSSNLIRERGLNPADKIPNQESGDHSFEQIRTPMDMEHYYNQPNEKCGLRGAK